MDTRRIALRCRVNVSSVFSIRTFLLDCVLWKLVNLKSDLNPTAFTLKFSNWIGLESRALQ